MNINDEENYEIKEKRKGVEIYFLDKHAVCRKTCFVKFNKILLRIDDGEWDDKPKLIMQMLDVWRQANCNKTTYDGVLLRRTIIAILFFIENKDKNGIVLDEWPEGKINEHAIYRNEDSSIHVSIGHIRLSMASHLEGEIIRRYGEYDWMNYSIAFYEDMMGDHGGLSAFGESVMNNLHDKLIEYMQDPFAFIQNNILNQQNIRQIH